MASGEPLAGVKQTLKEKRTSETTALDFVPSWAGQLQSQIELFLEMGVVGNDTLILAQPNPY
jgi:hypothetical protein